MISRIATHSRQLIILIGRRACKSSLDSNLITGHILGDFCSNRGIKFEKETAASHGSMLESRHESLTLAMATTHKGSGLVYSFIASHNV